MQSEGTVWQCRRPSKGKTFLIHKPSQPANTSPKINICRYRLGWKTNHCSSHANVTTAHFTNPYKHFLFYFWISSLTPSTKYSFRLDLPFFFNGDIFSFWWTHSRRILLGSTQNFLAAASLDFSQQFQLPQA